MGQYAAAWQSPADPKWTASVDRAPYYYHFDAAMPGMMPEPSTYPSVFLEALRNAGVRSLDGINDLARRMGLYWTNFCRHVCIPTERDRDERRFLYGISCIGEECPPCICAKNRACGRIGLPKRIEKHSHVIYTLLTYTYSICKQGRSQHRPCRIMICRCACRRISRLIIRLSPFLSSGSSVASRGGSGH